MSYFGILYQDRVTKWICRLYFNNAKKSISFPDGQNYNIDKLEDIYKYGTDIIKAFENRKG
nr:hypothetical protein [Campylobacter jejuni]